MKIMKGIKMKISLMLCLLFCAALAYSQTLIYRTTIGGKVSTFEYNPVIEPIGDSNELKIVTTDKSGLGNLEFTCDKDWNVKIWKFKNKDEGSDFTATRNDNIIKIEGQMNGRTVIKELKIDGKPWYQMIPFALSDFVKSGKESLEFWIVQKNKMEAIETIFKRGNVENIEIEGKIFETIKVRHTLPGVKGAFWGSDYWVRKTDGVYVKFKGLKGPPGSPEAVVELVGEK
jgi:hypothetical protein